MEFIALKYLPNSRTLAEASMSAAVVVVPMG
jgi:hypothetical protein